MADTVLQFHYPFPNATHLGGTRLRIAFTTLTRRADWMPIPRSLFVELVDPALPGPAVNQRLDWRSDRELSTKIDNLTRRNTDFGFYTGFLGLPVVPSEPRPLIVRLYAIFQPRGGGQPIPLAPIQIPLVAVSKNHIQPGWVPPTDLGRNLTSPVFDSRLRDLDGMIVPLRPDREFIASGDTATRPVDEYLEGLLIARSGDAHVVVDSESATWSPDVFNTRGRFDVRMRTPKTEIMNVNHYLCAYTRRIVGGQLTGGTFSRSFPLES